MTRSLTESLATQRPFLLPTTPSSLRSASSTSEGTRLQVTTLRRQLLTASAQLAVASSSSLGAQEKVGLLQGQLDAAQAEISHLHSQFTLLNAAKGAAEAHCTLRTLENEHLRKQLDETKRKSKRPRLQNSLGRFLTLPQAQVSCNHA